MGRDVDSRIIVVVELRVVVISSTRWLFETLKRHDCGCHVLCLLAIS